MKKYKALLLNLKQSCLNNDPKKVAFSIAIGFCVGLVPVLGITLVTITALGFLFKLNQLILQSIHLLVSPLQLVMIPVFYKTGQVIFGHTYINISSLSHEIANANFMHIFQQFGWAILDGLAVWVGFSIVVGFILYQLVLAVLKSSNRSAPTHCDSK